MTLVTLALIIVTYALIILWLLYVPLNASALVGTGHPKE